MMDGVTGEEVANIPLRRAVRASASAIPTRCRIAPHIHGPLLDACRAHELIELRTDCRGDRISGPRTPACRDRRSDLRPARSWPPALIGADGVYSNVRKQHRRRRRPAAGRRRDLSRHHPGRPTCRSTLQQPYPTFWAGPDWHMIYYPISDWSMFNLGCTLVTGQPEFEDGRGSSRPTWCCRISPTAAKIPDACHAHSEKLPPLRHRAPRAGRQLDDGRGDAARRRRPSDGAVHRAGRRDGAGGRDLPRQHRRRMRRRFCQGVPALSGHPHRAHRAGADLLADDGPAQSRQGRRAQGAQLAVRRPHAGAILRSPGVALHARRPM